jgi:hypothetical protein
MPERQKLAVLACYHHRSPGNAKRLAEEIEWESWSKDLQPIRKWRNVQVRRSVQIPTREGSEDKVTLP